MLTAALTVLLLGTAYAAPVNSTGPRIWSISSLTNATHNTETSSWWHSNPNSRGTSELLISCFSTLFFAAWTSYHPNIPTKDSRFAIATKRLKWIFLAAFVPEIVFWRAFAQRWAARRLMVQINQLGAECYASSQDGQNQSLDPRVAGAQLRAKTFPFGRGPFATVKELEAEKSRPVFTKWTMKQAFFAVSGGLAVESTSWYPREKIFFTPKGVLQLARAGLLPRLSKEQIEDKSSGNAFAKTVACLQAGWFAAHFFVRIAQGLPVSLLEIHTLLHLVSAYAIYTVWFEKGYDIGRPIFVEDERVVDMAAFFALETFACHPTNVEDDKLWTDGSTRRCEPWSCSHRSDVSMDHASEAQAYPMGPEFSWRLVNWIYHDMRENAKRPETDAEKIKAQSLRAQRAVLRLRKRNVHIYWRDARLRHEMGWRELDSSIKHFGFNDGPYATTDVGNAAITGALDENDLHSNTYWRPIDYDIAPVIKCGRCHTPEGRIVDDNASVHSGIELQGLVPHRSTSEDARSTHTLRIHCTGNLRSTDCWGDVKCFSDPDFSLKHGIEKDKLTVLSPGRLEKVSRVIKIKQLLIGLFSMCYGGAHLAAWNAVFGTVGDMWGWRSAGICLIAGPVCAALVAGLYPARKAIERIIHASEYLGIRALLRIPWALIFVIARISWALLLLTARVYPFARMYLLAESLADLRVGPPSLYDLPDWMAYVPHFH